MTFVPLVERSVSIAAAVCMWDEGQSAKRWTVPASAQSALLLCPRTGFVSRGLVLWEREKEEKKKSLVVYLTRGLVGGSFEESSSGFVRLAVQLRVCLGGCGSV